MWKLGKYLKTFLLPNTYIQLPNFMEFKMEFWILISMNIGIQKTSVWSISKFPFSRLNVLWAFWFNIISLDSSQEEFLLWLNIFYYLKTSCCSYGFLGTYITEGADRVASTFLKLPPVSRLFSYLTIINEKYGAPSKLIVETILKNGNSTASKTIVSVWKQLQTGEFHSNLTNSWFPILLGSGGKILVIFYGFLSSNFCCYPFEGILENYKDGVTGVRDAFRVLVNKQYLSALKIPAQDEKNERVPQISQDESEIARMPEIDASILNKMEAGEPVAAPDADIYWKCNVDRFHQDMR